MKKILRLLFFCLVCNVAFSSQAFEFAADFDGGDALVLRWQVQEGAYLYRDHISIEPELGSGLRLGHFKLPHAELKTFSGNTAYRVYQDEFYVKVPITYPNNGPLNLQVSYQGCSERGFCYPPVHKRLRLSVVEQTVFIDTVKNGFSVDLVNDQQAAASFLAEHTLFWIALAFVGLGLLLSLTPCVLPMVPVLSSIIVGDARKIKPLRAFSLSLVYVLTMSVTYALLELAVAHAGNYLQALWQETWVIVTFSGLFVLLALSMFGVYEFRLPASIEAKLGRVSRKSGGGSYVSVVVMGFLATLILSPCVTAPLIGVLSYIAVTGDQVLGAVALFSLGIGMGIPLLLIGTSAGFLLPRAGAWLDSVRVAFGVMLLALAIFLLQRVLPGSIALLLWGVLLIIVSVALGSFKAARTRVLKACRAIGLVIFVYAVVLLIGGAVGYTSLLYPFELSQNQSTLLFDDVMSMQQMQVSLAKAKAEKKPVLVYFHATWCTACKEIEKHVFQDARVKRALASYVLLRVDISKSNEMISPIENLFDVIAPPTIIFIEPTGRVRTEATVVGAVSPAFFLKRATLSPLS